MCLFWRALPFTNAAIIKNTLSFRTLKFVSRNSHYECTDVAGGRLAFISCAEKHHEFYLIIPKRKAGVFLFLGSFLQHSTSFSDKTWYQFKGMHKSGLILFLKYCAFWLGWMTRVLNCTESNFQQLIPCAVLWWYFVLFGWKADALWVWHVTTSPGGFRLWWCPSQATAEPSQLGRLHLLWVLQNSSLAVQVLLSKNHSRSDGESNIKIIISPIYSLIMRVGH